MGGEKEEGRKVYVEKYREKGGRVQNFFYKSSLHLS